MKEYKWGFCGLCQCWFVYCPTCINNCCNATYGEVNGKPCPDCPDAYEFQHKHWDLYGKKWRKSLDKNDFPKELTMDESLVDKTPQEIIDEYKAWEDEFWGRVTRDATAKILEEQTIKLNDEQWNTLLKSKDKKDINA